MKIESIQGWDLALYLQMLQVRIDMSRADSVVRCSES